MMLNKSRTSQSPLRWTWIALAFLVIVVADEIETKGAATTPPEAITTPVLRKEDSCDVEDIPLDDDCPGFESPLPADATGDIEFYYMERVMSSRLGQKRKRFSAYHSALGFVLKNTQQMWTMDFAPHVLTLEYTYLPKLEHSWGDWGAMSEAAQMAGVGETTVTWLDSGSNRMSNSIDKSYKKKSLLGHFNVSTFAPFLKWFNHYNCTHRRFQIFSVINSNVSNILSSSHNCHDFCQAGILKLGALGATFTRKKALGRDFTLMYSNEMVPVNASDPEVHKDIVRFYTYIWRNKDFINENFGNCHDVSKDLATSGMKYYYYNGEQYFHVNLVPPYLDYCYANLAIPPKTKVDFTSMYCMIRDEEERGD